MTGAVFHNLGQIGVAFLLTSVPAVLVYLPFLLSQRSGDRSVHRSLCPLYASLPSVRSTGSSDSICVTVLCVMG